MVRIQDIIKAAKPKLGELSEDMEEYLKKTLVQVFKDEAAPKLKDAFLRVYDDLAAEEKSATPAGIAGDDHLSLERLRPLFERQLDEELTQIKISEGRLVVDLLDRDKLGFGNDTAPKNPPDTVDSLAYYIDGVVGEFAFISLDHYEEMRDSRDGSKFGRLGQGFMIPRYRYEREGWQRRTGLSFNQVRHPVSAVSPFNGFDSATESIDFNVFVNKAVEMTARAFQNREL